MLVVRTSAVIAWLSASRWACLLIALAAAACGHDEGAPPQATQASTPHAASGPASATAGSSAVTAAVPTPRSARPQPALPNPAPAEATPAVGAPENHTTRTTDEGDATTLPVGPARPVPEAPGFERPTVMDARPPVTSTLRTLPVSGGTLLITRDGAQIYAADPERDRVSVVDVLTHTLSATVSLTPGEQPGRMVEDDAGRVHVVLRGAAAIATIDPWDHSIVARRDVCAEPRGISLDPSDKQLRVACMSGELVSLPQGDGDVSSRVYVDHDLRDLVPVGDSLYVTRARSADLLELNTAGEVKKRLRPETPRKFFLEASGALIADTVEPVLARRAIPARDGGVLVLHQGARNGDIEVRQMQGADPNLSPYGGNGNCQGVVTTELSRFDATGKLQYTVALSDVLAVDVAESDTGEIAIAAAGVADTAQPLNSEVPPDMKVPSPATAPAVPAGGASFPAMSVRRYFPADLERVSQQEPSIGCAAPIQGEALPGPATAVAYLSDGRLVAQTREPARVFITGSTDPRAASTQIEVDLGGPSLYDTGHELFHRDAGAGVACASCHLEGGDDGHVWRFTDQGPRRTQALNIGLEGTAPFHWVGDLASVGALMDAVFVGRMGGAQQSEPRVQALEQWLYSLTPPAPLRASTDPAVERGRALFEGEAECSDCHRGPKLTDNETTDVGTGVELQTPSLVGIAHRAPFMHNGCATILRDRFEPACGGGDDHGRTTHLSDAQIDDLIAYMESL